MKRSFIRAIWGNVSEHRNGKIAKEIASVSDKSWFTVYTFGKDNHKWLTELGFNSRIVDYCPVKFNLETEMYRHKLEVFLYATADFDEFAFLDWDCVPVSDMSDCWEKLNKKESFQANLFQYRTKKCLWRDCDHRKVCNGGFAYFRDNSIPNKMINYWEGFRSWTVKQEIKRKSKGLDLRFREKCLTYDDEPSMSRYVDDFFGSWCGSEKYWDFFEPSVCNLKKKSAFSDKMLESKNACFIHNL